MAYNTVIAYIQNIKHIKNGIGSLKLQKIKASDIQKLYKNLSYDLSGKSLQHLHNTLNLAFKYAIKDRLIDHNPLDQVDRSKKSKYHANIIHPSKIKEYLKLYEDSWIYPAVCLALFGGLRRGEILALQWNDINFNQMKININKAVIAERRKLVVKKTKTEENRTIFIQSGLAKILKMHKRKQLRLRMLLGNEYHVNNYVVTEENGKRPHPGVVSRFFSRRMEKSNLQKVRFHDLRHSAGSLMVMSGVDLKTVSDFLGHSSITITADIYSHIIEEHRRAAANTLEKYIT